MADYDWFDRSEPTEAERLASQYRPQGVEAVFTKSRTISGQPIDIMYYRCRRGCGTLVWNPEEHIRNVCTRWEPVVGES